MSALAIKKDTYQYLAQNQLGAGINAIGAALTEVLNAEKSSEHTVDVSKFIERLADAGRILSDLHHDMSKTRKSFIVPRLNPIVKHIADDSSIDKWLFGEKFSESLKTAKAMEKSSKDLVKQGSGQRRSFDIETRGENRRFQLSRSRQGEYSNQHQSGKLNWHRPSGMTGALSGRDRNRETSGPRIVTNSRIKHVENCRKSTIFSPCMEKIDYRFILQCVKGYVIPFESKPHSRLKSIEPRLTAQEMLACEIEIGKLLEKGAISRCNFNKINLFHLTF